MVDSTQQIVEPGEWYVDEPTGQCVWYSVRGWNGMRIAWLRRLHEFYRRCHAKHIAVPQWNAALLLIGGGK